MPHYAGFSSKTESRYRCSRGVARHLRQRRMPQQRRICTMPVVDEHSSKDAKIALFRGLFRGREDVYAFRMRFKNGEWG